MVICFKVKEKTFCIRIPDLIDWNWRHPPRPDPPPPWRDWINPGDPAGWKQDLAIVATVDELSRMTESRALQAGLIRVAEEHARKIQEQHLPEAEISLHNG